MILNRKIVLLIIIVSVAVYWNSFNENYIYDDKYIIENNSQIKNINNIPSLFIKSYWEGTGKGVGQNLWRPLVMCSYAIDYAVWKLNAFGYHLTNVVLHTLNSILMFYFMLIIMKRTNSNNLMRNQIIAIFTVLLFTVHSVHTEVVTGIVGRAELMAAFFYLLALIMFTKMNNSVIMYALSLSSFAMALLSKEIAVSLPGILVLYDFYSGQIKRGSIIKRTKKYIGYIFVILFYLASKAIIFGELLPNVRTSILAGKSVLLRVLTIIKVFIYYVKLLFYPIDLRIIYNKNIFLTDKIDLVSIIFLCLCVLVFYLLCKYYKKLKLAVFGIVWLMITMFPISNLIILIGELIAERFLYLPSIGFCILSGTIIFEIWPENSTISKHNRFIFLVILILIISFHSILTLKRNNDWSDGTIFWSRELSFNPNSNKVLNHRGVYYKRKKQYEKAIADFSRVIENNPRDSKAYNNRGECFNTMELYNKAIVDFTRAIELSQNISIYYNNRGAVYLRKEFYDNAIKDIENSIRLKPNSASAHINLGIALQYIGKYDEAVNELLRAKELDRSFPQIYNILGVIYTKSKRYKEAESIFKEGLDISPGNKELMHNLSEVHKLL